MGFMTTGLLRASSTVYLQRKVLQVAFLKIICPEILFFPKPPEELVFHKNAFGNTEATRAQSPKMQLLYPKEKIFAVFYGPLMLNVKTSIQIFFPPHTWTLKGTTGPLTRTPYPPLHNRQKQAIFILPWYQFMFGFSGNTHLKWFPRGNEHESWKLLKKKKRRTESHETLEMLSL